MAIAARDHIADGAAVEDGDFAIGSGSDGSDVASGCGVMDVCVSYTGIDTTNVSADVHVGITSIIDRTDIAVVNVIYAENDSGICNRCDCTAIVYCRNGAAVCYFLDIAAVGY